jgi:hypothetical protein
MRRRCVPRKPRHRHTAWRETTSMVSNRGQEEDLDVFGKGNATKNTAKTARISNYTESPSRACTRTAMPHRGHDRRSHTRLRQLGHTVVAVVFVHVLLIHLLRAPNLIFFAQRWENVMGRILRRHGKQRSVEMERDGNAEVEPHQGTAWGGAGGCRRMGRGGQEHDAVAERTWGRDGALGAGRAGAGVGLGSANNAR